MKRSECIKKLDAVKAKLYAIAISGKASKDTEELQKEMEQYTQKLVIADRLQDIANGDIETLGTDGVIQACSAHPWMLDHVPTETLRWEFSAEAWDRLIYCVPTAKEKYLELGIEFVGVEWGRLYLAYPELFHEHTPEVFNSWDEEDVAYAVREYGCRSASLMRSVDSYLSTMSGEGWSIILQGVTILMVLKSGYLFQAAQKHNAFDKMNATDLKFLLRERPYHLVFCDKNRHLVVDDIRKNPDDWEYVLSEVREGNHSHSSRDDVAHEIERTRELWAKVEEDSKKAP